MTIPQPEKRTKTQSQTPESSENPSNSDPQKKTRDLPNLTECHGCGFKIDVCTSGKNKLRTLYSEWRIVLLCNKCFSSIESSRICSYCFSGTLPDSLRCIKCNHSVHKNCFLKYKNVAPWSYSCLDSEFSVCVDCWIPKHLEISRRRKVRRRLRKMKNGVIGKKGSVDLEKESYRVLKDVVKDANDEVKKKLDAAARARDAATKKAVAARKAVELANNALSLVANREKSTLNLHRKKDSVKFVGDSYLTLDLHLNSSARNSKSRCLLNRSYLDAPKIWTFSVDSSCKTSNLRNARGCDKALCEPSVSLGSLDSDSSTDLNEGEGSCSDRLINISGEDCGLELDRKQADSAFHGGKQLDRYFFTYSRRSESDRYRLKYSRRSDRYILKYSRRSDRYLLKYSRRKCLKQNLDS